MIITEAENHYVLYRRVRNVLDRHARLKRIVVVLTAFTLFTVAILASMAYGMYLHKTGESMTLRQWAESLAKHKLGFVPNYVSGLFASPESISIDIKFKHYQKLAHKRQGALTSKKLNSTSADWVPATLTHRGVTYRASVRLKGDLSDHWRREHKWSYKIKLKDQKTLFGMRRFAIQDPLTRFHLNEWFFHELQKYFGLIHLRYDFLNVTINGKDESIYAIEENFDKRLIEHNNLREGAIVRFDSDYIWGNTIGLLPIYLGASVEPSQEGTTAADPVLQRQFNVAKNLIELYRRNELTVGEVFDVVKLARLFALADLAGYRHVLSLDNLRFYYNPVTSLLEPIGYDFNQFKFTARNGYGLLGAGKFVVDESSKQPRYTRFSDDVFRDRRFYEHYVRSLEEVSQKSFLDDFFEQTDSAYREKLQILHKAFPWYHFEGKEILYANQEYIRSFLTPYKSVQAYYHRFVSEDGKLFVKLRNIHAMPVEVLGITASGNAALRLEKPLVLPAAVASQPISSTLAAFTAPQDFEWQEAMAEELTLNSRILGSERPAQERVFPWSDVDDGFLETDLLRREPNLGRFSFVTVDEESRQIVLEPGVWEIRESLIVPASYRLVARGGLTLNLSEGASIVSRSPIFFLGTEDAPIVVTSSDSSGQGLAVLGAQEDSILQYVTFDNLANPSRGDWELTGGVTFYESPVRLSHCRFRRSRSEDALNILRAEFTIDNSTFTDAQSDAFDGDFVRGSILDSAFLNSVNDAIDVSGSVVHVERLVVDGAGDKALSAGENSQLTARGVEIRNVELGVTSKDQSSIDIEDAVLLSNRVAFAAYRKKSEYGPASISARNCRLERAEVPYLVEVGSKLVWNNLLKEPTGENVSSLLYGAQYGRASQ